jgi:aspartyl-tRNA(Asn)/glutamyl-tRNA(Gln) amidotransferase subunit A
MTDLHYLSATDAISLFSARELSPVELMQSVIERAEVVEPKINAFANTMYEEALEKARSAEQRYLGSGAAPRALEGIPIAVKEEAAIAGQPNTLGSLPLRDVVADQTAVFVQRILDAGGIVHARTTTPEFSCAGFTWSRLWGVTRNPWNLQYSPGGSSGGSAASLAVGSSTLATGSDIGGSIRIPASFCGIAGFKPPYGRVPEGEIFNLDHYCHEGPLARTVRDLALFENVIAGPHPSDVASLRPKLELPTEYGVSLEGMKVAYSADLGGYRVDGDVARNASAAADVLRRQGAAVDEVKLPWELATINRAARIHFGLIFGASIGDIYEKHRDELTSYARRFFEESQQVRKEELVAGLELEARIYAPLGELLESYDALLCPTFGVPALPADYDEEPIEVNGELVSDSWDLMMTIPFNIASRCPVMSIPSGYASSGVPTGVSIVGRTYDDLTVFRIAAAFESAQPWLDRPERRPTI